MTSTIAPLTLAAPAPRLKRASDPGPGDPPRSGAAIHPSRRRSALTRQFGRILGVALVLALTAAMLPLWMVYSFIWLARL
jgi:hypothetical protein